MAKVKVIVVEDELMGRGETTVLDIEVREFVTKNDVADAVSFAQKVIEKAKKL